ncbi:hypothetical protein EYF80_000908 [Liparis tanakae]|uniref:Uncharacterized protein n=1 Tax=Liparis tanakae TaxID=230148 RepID=A0A4Z2JFJ0_9TELE|nr:hypothetical protein EYF80_000908 [Liparis tanakae]
MSVTCRLLRSRLCCTYLGCAAAEVVASTSSTCFSSSSSSLEKHTLSWLSVPLVTKPSSSSLEQAEVFLQGQGCYWKGRKDEGGEGHKTCHEEAVKLDGTAEWKRENKFDVTSRQIGINPTPGR